MSGMFTLGKLRKTSMAMEEAQDIFDDLKHDQFIMDDYLRDIRRGNALYHVDLLGAKHDLNLIASYEHPDIHKLMPAAMRRAVVKLRTERGFKEGEVLALVRAGKSVDAILKRVPNPRPSLFADQQTEIYEPAKDGRRVVKTFTTGDEYLVYEERLNDNGVWVRDPLSERREVRNRHKILVMDDGSVEVFEEWAQVEIFLASIVVGFGFPYFLSPWFGFSWGADKGTSWVILCVTVGMGLFIGISLPSSAKLVSTVYGMLRGAVLGVLSIPMGGIICGLTGITSHFAQYTVVGALWGLAILLSAIRFRHSVGRRTEVEMRQ